MRTKLFLMILLSVFSISANAQTMAKIADDTFGYVKVAQLGN